MALTPIYTFHTARRLCQLDLSAATLALIAKPSPLKDNAKPENHIVTLPVAGGTIVLFPIAVNGQMRVATTTPDLVLANSAGA